jgi:hypothetical protein
MSHVMSANALESSLLCIFIMNPLGASFDLHVSRLQRVLQPSALPWPLFEAQHLSVHQCRLCELRSLTHVFDTQAGNRASDS